MEQRLCNNFRVDGNSCSSILSSIDGNDLLLDIVETEKLCIRQDGTACTRTNIDKLRSDELSLWKCIDKFCMGKSDRLIKGRKYYINKLDSAFNKFRGL